jgi:hypothetical protein
MKLILIYLLSVSLFSVNAEWFGKDEDFAERLRANELDISLESSGNGFKSRSTSIIFATYEAVFGEVTRYDHIKIMVTKRDSLLFSASNQDSDQIMLAKVKKLRTEDDVITELVMSSKLSKDLRNRLGLSSFAVNMIVMIRRLENDNDASHELRVNFSNAKGGIFKKEIKYNADLGEGVLRTFTRPELLEEDALK